MSYSNPINPMNPTNPINSSNPSNPINPNNSMNPTNPSNSSNPRKRILLISYYYPPLTDVGCKRSVAFAKYLKKYGWEPYVLSVKNPDKTFCSLGNEKPPSGISTEYSYSVVNIYKFFGKLNALLLIILKFLGIEMKSNYFYDIFCIPDFFWGWIPLTTLKGYNIINKFNIDIIYVSCRPFSSAVIGILLKFITKKPLVIDFRDAYALETRSLNWLFLRPEFRKKMDKWIENKILKYTDIFITVTQKLKELYIHQYPQVRDKIFVIHNGFDSEFIPEEKSCSKYTKFTIVYVGNFYFSALDQNIFFEALAFLKNREGISKNTFQFLFYGEGKDRIAQISKCFGVEDLVIVNSRISYRDIIKVITKSYLQLLRVVEAAVPTKLFEGLSLNVPFLATSPNAEAEQIIRKYSPSSYIIEEESAEKVAEAILDAITKYKKHEIKDNYVKEFLESFSRENLTLKLMKIIEKNL